MTKLFDTEAKAAEAGEAFCLANMATFGEACTDTAQNADGKWFAVVKQPHEDFDRVVLENGQLSQ